MDCQPVRRTPLGADTVCDQRTLPDDEAPQRRPVPGGIPAGAGEHADSLSATALLGCLIREIARPHLCQDTAGGHAAYLLPATGALLRVGAGRHPTEPELRTADGWSPLAFPALAALVTDELTRHTGLPNHTLAGEITASRDTIAAFLDARATADPPRDLYIRSEQALLAGHRHHPAPKARGTEPPGTWLPYAPEAHARFPLALLAVRADLLAQEGDCTGLDSLGTAPPGYRLLPAHPWQLALLGDLPAFHDGRIRRLGETSATVVPTSSLRTVYLPEADLFCKFSLDVRITNDIRRLWTHDLRRLRTIDVLLRSAFADLPPHSSAGMLADRGHRTADLADADSYGAFAVIVRDGPRAHLDAGTTPLLTAGVSEGFPGNPLDSTTAEGALTWWRRYLHHVVPAVLHAFFRHGLVLECHLQNVLVCVDDTTGLPAKVLFRDHEGVKLLAGRHTAPLHLLPPGTSAPVVEPAEGWHRLTYCLVTNNLHEIAGAITQRHPHLAGTLWPHAQQVFAACGAAAGDPPEIHDLLATTHIPAKANLLLRWLGADGASSRYVPMPNPLRTSSTSPRQPGTNARDAR
ncbi:IucA/IucC family protein [Streptomyces sp. NPDC088348]|uniref:IucA/IucC family protein n=1 Tax=Streptomyces sp. NPDC088348 TaxID=3365853 RepID=UPI0038291DA2